MSCERDAAQSSRCRVSTIALMPKRNSKNPNLKRKHSGVHLGYSRWRGALREHRCWSPPFQVCFSLLSFDGSLLKTFHAYTRPEARCCVQFQWLFLVLGSVIKRIMFLKARRRVEVVVTWQGWGSRRLLHPFVPAHPYALPLFYGCQHSLPNCNI
jgi:hypothetical protein